MTTGTARRLRRRVTCAVALVSAWTIGFVGLAPAAAAEDMRAQQWYLDAMHVDKIWKKTTGEGIKVALIDTGVNASTPTLRGQVLKGVDATEVNGKTDDNDSHGTTMAELIAGTGRAGGIQGLAPGVKIIPFRTNTSGSEELEKNPWDIEDAIRAAADSDAQIINMSFATKYDTDRMIEAVKYAHSKGKLMFAGVGNEGDEENAQRFPAAYPEVVGVAATDRKGTVGKFSQHGDFVDIAAPGKGIPGWCNAKFDGYCINQQGTSHATAIASAAAALIWSLHPDWTANQVLRVMFESAARSEGWKPGTTSSYLGHGIVRPGAHINRGLGKPGDPNINPLTNENTTGAKGGSSASPAASAPASSQAPQGRSTPGQTVAGSGGEAGDGNSLGLILGGAAAVVVVAGGVFFVRKRRTA
ncbi:S8 family serine peptidase [Streptomyces somaliensis]|uniref:S8 family serine peptidase n=1 Tax=Streptomyces somaliensis TaxID=78355 RepID=UPI0020CFD362|nr:S8 family serine peptidase [Streptomyces somaliensis]MCP9944392.1 S8 family serine peptidase [Streptomyces somaliensis]MCP9962375.1 S8 family serine peptidase [Streptomyces somaliensis]MCP9975193.1 S8 family serine peptidase [Streptomyces somaliensis]